MLISRRIENDAATRVQRALYFQSEMFYGVDIFCLEIAAFYANLIGEHAIQPGRDCSLKAALVKNAQHSKVIFKRRYM